MMRVDPLTVALIRALNSSVISVMDSDQDLMDMFGQGAQPLSDGIREAIREEMSK